MQLSDFTGLHELSGVDYCEGHEGEMNVRFCLDGVTYLAEEDPDDGYRSYMKELKISETPCKNVFPRQTVFCEYDDGRHNDLLDMKNTGTGDLILRIGTEDIDDYYPICRMEWNPENMPCNKKECIGKYERRS